MTKPTASYETIRKERDYLLSLCGRQKIEIEALNAELTNMANRIDDEKRTTERVRTEIVELMKGDLS